MQTGFGPRNCPGLTVTATGVFWRDSLNREYDLQKEKRLSAGEVAQRMNRSPDWVLRQIRSGDLYPVVYYNSRALEVWECALSDFLIRSLTKNQENKTDVAA